MSRTYDLGRLMAAMVLCLLVLVGATGCIGSSDPMPLAEYDEIKNDPELLAIVNSGKGPKQVREEIEAKIRSRQQAAVADAKADARKKKKR